MFIRSERLFLRPGWPEDERQLLALIDDAAIVRNLARAPWPYTLDDARDFIARPQDGRAPHFFVTLPTASGPQLVGSAGLIAHEGGVELGYWIGRPFWGQGYATEAARGVLALARTLGHRRITAAHFVDNPASKRVLTKLGFRASGITGSCASPARGTSAAIEHYQLALGDAPGAANEDDRPPGGMAA